MGGKNEKNKKKTTAAGFEPALTNEPDFKSGALDHSAKLPVRY